MNKKDIRKFEEEYARIRDEKGVAAAKAFFRSKFMVTCFRCGHLGRVKPPLNCEKCGQYLD